MGRRVHGDPSLSIFPSLEQHLVVFKVSDLFKPHLKYVPSTKRKASGVTFYSGENKINITPRVLLICYLSFQRTVCTHFHFFFLFIKLPNFSLSSNLISKLYHASFTIFFFISTIIVFVTTST